MRMYNYPTIVIYLYVQKDAVQRNSKPGSKIFWKLVPKSPQYKANISLPYIDDLMKY